MKLVPAGEPTREDLYIQHILNEHPLVKYRLAILLNMYRQLAVSGFEGMRNGETDTADGVISLSKKDTIMRCLDIPILENTMEDWEYIRRQWYAAQEKALPD